MDELLARVESNPMNVPRSLFSNLDVVLFPMHIKKGERSMRRLANIVEMLELDRESGALITNTVFKWLPDVDEFQYQGRSFLFDKIKDTHGVSKEVCNGSSKTGLHSSLTCRDLVYGSTTQLLSRSAHITGINPLL